MSSAGYDPIRLQRAGLSLTLDPGSVLDLRSVTAGGVDWAPGLEIVDDGDPRIWHSLQGMLFTCGPDHIRHPEAVGQGTSQYPLHGSLAGNAVTALAVSADGDAADASVSVALADGGMARLDRRWQILADGTALLNDRVTNTGATAFAPMLMYHINIGGRLLGAETRLTGPMLEDGGFPWDFRDDPGGVFCVSAAETAGEDGFARLSLGPVAAAGDLTLTLRFPVSALPFLQLWRCRRPGVNVLGLEPVSHRLEKRALLDAAREMPLLQPGQSREYGLAFAFHR